MFCSKGVDMASDVDVGGISRLPQPESKWDKLNLAADRIHENGSCIWLVVIGLVVGDLLLYRAVVVELMRPDEREKKRRLQGGWTLAMVAASRDGDERPVEERFKWEVAACAVVIVFRE
jgi:hypothetical protein